MVNHFWGKVLKPFWKRFLWHKQFIDARVIIHRLSSFTVTSLKFTPNMEILISPKKKWSLPLKSSFQYRSDKFTSGQWRYVGFRRPGPARCKIELNWRLFPWFFPENFQHGRLKKIRWFSKVKSIRSSVTFHTSKKLYTYFMNTHPHYVPYIIRHKHVI